MRPSPRILELAQRLVASGPKCGAVSASETHEIANFILELADSKEFMDNTNQTQTADEKLDCWAVVELFGHNKISGKIKEVSIAGGAMLRVDVPAIGEQKAYTRFFGHAAIYSINPTTEEIATGMVASCSSAPVNRYELPKLAETNPYPHASEQPFHENEEPQ